MVYHVVKIMPFLHFCRVGSSQFWAVPKQGFTVSHSHLYLCFHLCFSLGTRTSHICIRWFAHFFSLSVDWHKVVFGVLTYHWDWPNFSNLESAGERLWLAVLSIPNCWAAAQIFRCHPQHTPCRVEGKGPPSINVYWMACAYTHTHICFPGWVPKKTS